MLEEDHRLNNFLVTNLLSFFAQSSSSLRLLASLVFSFSFSSTAFSFFLVSSTWSSAMSKER